MDDTASRLGKLAAVLILATGVAGCLAPPPGQPTVLGCLGIGTPAQLLAANAASNNAAIAQAAKVKQEKCLKCKKIKAIKYLSHIGCGCYDKDGAVSKALLASLGDCDEQVRLATVKAIMTTAKSGACQACGSVSCCKKDIVEQLAKMAYELDDKGCWIEPSERVRNLAAQAAEICCPCQWPQYDMSPAPVQQSDPVQQTDPNSELKKEPAAVEGIDQPVTPVQPGTGDEAARRRYLRDRAIAIVYTQVQALDEDEIPAIPAVAHAVAGASEENDDGDDAPGRAFICRNEDPIVVYRNLAVAVPAHRMPTGGDRAVVVGRPRQLVTIGRRSANDGSMRGIVRYVDEHHGVAHVEFGGTKRVAPGTRIVVEHQALFGKLATSGLLEVVSSEPGAATVKALGDYKISRVASGDQVFVSQENS